ncbi:MAG: heme-binding protein [Gemmatimonadota bacterium]|nr:heme-binding protein [Gemmatimonadales bacterium]MDQ3138167.1 heme-binding protein [Gemmatimonadota bacterium]
MHSFLFGGGRTAIAAALGLTLVLTACGDDDNNDGGLVGPDGSPSLPTYDQLKAALDFAQAQDNKGFGLDMWATVVDRSGIVRAIAFTGDKTGDQWPASRVISAQKASTANSLSLTNLSLATANLYSAVQPGGSLFGLQESNPVNTDAAYGGNADDYGTLSDYMIEKRIGGVNVFGGGLALYDASGEVIGAVGVSGDTSCADHSIAWKLRDQLVLDFVPGGVDPASGFDNIVYDIDGNGASASGWGHPACPLVPAEVIAEGQALPTAYPVSPVTP